MNNFGVLMDADLMRSLLNEQYRHFVIQRLSIDRIRYRPDHRATVTYNVDGYCKHTQKEQDHRLTATVVLTKSVSRRFRQLTRHAIASNLGVDTVARLPFDIIVQRFPLDRALFQLPGVLTTVPAQIQSFLQRHTRSATTGVTLSVARYRPGFGITLRCAMHAHDQRIFYLKYYRKGIAQPTNTVHKNLFQQATRLGISIAEPLFFSPRFECIVMPEMPGIELGEILDKGLDETSLLQDVAEGLAKLHRTDLCLEKNRHGHALNLRLSKATTLITLFLPELAVDLNKITENIATYPFKHLAPAHCDLKPDHIFISGSNVSFIDVDSFAYADPIYDAAILALRVGAFGKSAANMDFADGFIEVYCQCRGIQDRHRIAINVAAAALKIVLYYVQHQVEDWQTKTRVLVKQTARILNEPDAPIPFTTPALTNP